MQFITDKISGRGAKADGSFTVSMELGEYQRQEFAKLMSLPPDQAYKITVEVYNG